MCCATSADFRNINKGISFRCNEGINYRVTMHLDMIDTWFIKTLMRYISQTYHLAPQTSCIVFALIPTAVLPSTDFRMPYIHECMVLLTNACTPWLWSVLNLYQQRTEQHVIRSWQGLPETGPRPTHLPHPCTLSLMQAICRRQFGRLPS